MKNAVPLAMEADGVLIGPGRYLGRGVSSEPCRLRGGQQLPKPRKQAPTSCKRTMRAHVDLCREYIHASPTVARPVTFLVSS